MMEDAIRRFAQENFSHKYFPVLHGETDKIQPLALVVKQHRSIWKRPFAKMEMVILAGFERYVEKSAEEAVRESVASKIREEELKMKQRIDLGGREEEFDVSLGGYAGGTIKLNDDQGVLILGALSQKYIEDLDLRDILANAELDANKMETFAECDKLLLITSVIYSEKFELKGKRRRQEEGNFELRNLPPYLQFIMGNRDPIARLHYKSDYTPPEAVVSNSEAPFLFKCCRVDYNKETNRLEIRKGEYVGKTIERAMGDTPNESNEEEDEYDDTLVDATDQTDLSDCLTTKDISKLDNITKVVLLAEKTRARRKARVSKYLRWFEEALMTDQNKLMLDDPLTSEDCRFLRSAYLPCATNTTMLDLTSLSKEDIQAYGIVFKVLNDLPDEQWKELEMTLAAGGRAE
ncbi:uncharacterized protein LOC144642066 [Oculina patagonica]